MRLLISLLFISLTISLHAQKKTALVSGKILDEKDVPLSNVSITILGKQNGILSNDSGFFSIKLPAGRAVALVFSHSGFKTIQKNLILSNGEQESVNIVLTPQTTTLKTVVIQDERERKEIGLTRVNPRDALLVPSTTGGVEALIKILVGSNNELTSQYNVRGGNYDENLIYINDFEIFRPYLVNNAQQEGLSFINPELTKNISFYNGGFQAKYGDKISSVLDIQYKKPTQTEGSAYVSLLEQGFHLEGSDKKNRFSYLLGVRNRTNRNLLASQETKGNYVPSSSDIQSLLSYRVNDHLQLELLGILSGNNFFLIPESAQKSSAVFSPLFTSNIGLDIFFDGQEKDNYRSNLLGFSLIQQPRTNLKLKWMASHSMDIENENYDIAGTYLFGERSFDKTSSSFGQIVNPLGAGIFQNYARNHLDINVWTFSHKGFLEKGKHYIQWGLSFEQTKINDRLHEFQYQDSAGYSLPFNPNNIVLSQVLNSNEQLSINKYSGFLQDNINLSHSSNEVSLQLGIRYNYNSLNKEFLISPRMQLSYKPVGKSDIVYKVAAGIYDQPPFYREMLSYSGYVNTALKSQKSIQFVSGIDYNFKNLNKPVRLTTEVYYKALKDVVPYDLDNVRIQYFGVNNAQAYATGIEMRLYSELVKDAESWFSIGIMQTKEKIENAHFYNYKNAAGEVITSHTVDQKITDSVRIDQGYVRRPSDRLLTLGLFLQDYLTTNKNFRVYLNLIYGSNMPYNIQNSIKYRNALIIEPYIRADLGFSALLLNEKSLRRSHNPFKGFKNIWASLEVFNLIDRANTISYQLVKDYSNNIFSIPNRLTPRLLNFKLLARF